DAQGLVARHRDRLRALSPLRRVQALADTEARGVAGGLGDRPRRHRGGDVRRGGGGRGSLCEGVALNPEDDRPHGSSERRVPSPRSRAFVRWTLRWGGWLWALALALAVPATWRTAGLYAHLRSELEQLLPRSAPSVIAIDELRTRMAGLQHLGVVVDTGSAANLRAGERLLDDLASRVRAYPPRMVRAVRTGDASERRFLEDHAPLYMDLADLETVRQRVEARRDWEASKEQGALLDEDDPPPPLDFDDIEKKYDHRSSSFEDDHFASRERHTALLLIEVGEFDTGRVHSEALLGRVKSDLGALHPESYAPGLTVGFTSDVAINTEETQALVSDLTLSSIVVVVLVVAVIVLY